MMANATKMKYQLTKMQVANAKSKMICSLVMMSP